MEELTFKATGPPIGDAERGEMERHLRVKLPPKYRAFLKRNNDHPGLCG